MANLNQGVTFGGPTLYDLWLHDLVGGLIDCLCSPITLGWLIDAHIFGMAPPTTNQFLEHFEDTK